jgi:hypothetical protein
VRRAYQPGLASFRRFCGSFPPKLVEKPIDANLRGVYNRSGK